MSAHPYSLRSRISSSSLTTKTPGQSPASKQAKSPRKGSSSPPVLQLKHVVGTTTSTPSGLSCCLVSNSYAYCAGSVAVLAKIDSDYSVSYRYFKARPTAVPINQNPSYYDSPSASNTPTRRKTVLSGRRLIEDNGGSVWGSHWLDDGAGQTWSARERIKAASCVSISLDGRILAVGETGYNPRVLLFSTTANGSTDVPLSIITDHTIGVRCVAFSPNSRYLATLGDVNDGFLYIWQVNTKTGVVKLHSSNKCTANVYDMTWCGNNVVTVGTRHIKIWQAPNSGNVQSNRKPRAKHEGDSLSLGPAPLHGRNCLLGTFADATFTSVVAISEGRAVVCADDGNICQIDLSQTRPEISSLEKVDDKVAALSCRQNSCRLIWGNSDGLLEERDLTVEQGPAITQTTDADPLKAYQRGRMTRRSLLRQSLGLSPLKIANIVALGCLEATVICISSEGAINVSRLDADNSQQDICKVASHNGPVRGIEQLPRDAGLGSFFTWDKAGEVRFWSHGGENLDTRSVDLDNSLDAGDDAANELRSVRYSLRAQAFIFGDTFGVLKIIDQSSWRCLHTLRAHGAGISSIDAQDRTNMIATCGRDRMVQIFRFRGQDVELLQTSDDHISAVNQVLFSQNGNRLISCSVDRTIVVRELIESKTIDDIVYAFIATRTVTMKAAPLSMGILPAQADKLVVSTQDRQISQIDLNTGTILGSFKVSDRETDDTVSLNAICLSESIAVDKGCLVAGYSMTDKSVRLYDLEKGLLLGRDAGHTEGVSDICMFRADEEGQPGQTTIVSTGLDGTIMVWSVAEAGRPNLTPQHELSLSQIFGTDPEKAVFMPSPASLPPMRKILSKMDIAEFARQSSPTRDVSPNALRRKTSRLALATSVEEDDEAPSSRTAKGQACGQVAEQDTRSPSPPTQSTLRLERQRSRPELSKAVPTSVPSTPRHNTRANNSRLRRPPSVPNDLRAHAAAQARRQSVSAAQDFGNISMATEQACRMLKAFQKKLHVSNSDVDLDEVEADLESALRTVRQKKTKMGGVTQVIHAMAVKENADDQVDRLSVLLEKANVS